ncbi:MAG: hypothetical protein U0232_03505 [Thermomicrobiales bacterium]
MQTVHGIRALIEPTPDVIRQEFVDADTLFAVLINSRAAMRSRRRRSIARSRRGWQRRRERLGDASR